MMAIEKVRGPISNIKKSEEKHLNTLFGLERSKIEGCPHQVNYFPGFLGKNIKNCPPSKLDSVV